MIGKAALLLTLAAIGAGQIVHAGDAGAPFERNFYSSDQTYDVTGIPVYHSAYVETDASDNPTAIRGFFLYPGEDLTGVHEFSSNTVYFTSDQTVDLFNQVITPRDVAQAVDANNWSLVFDGAAHGVPLGVKIDAVTMVDDKLVLSFDQSLELHGVALAHNDLVQIDGPGSASRIPVAPGSTWTSMPSMAELFPFCRI